MSDVNTAQADEPSGNHLTRLKQSADWTAFGKLAAAGTLGLAANGVGIAAVVGGGGVTGIAEGIANLTPAIAISGALFHRYDPVDLPYLSPILLFVTLALANTLSLVVNIFSAGPQSDPLMSAILLGFVALMFTPGPFLGMYAARRWWL